MSTFLDVESLNTGLQQRDPRAYQIIQLLNRQLEEIRAQLDPLVRQSQLGEGEIAKDLAAPLSGTVSFPGLTVRLQWTLVQGAAFYEVRKGIDWDTANFITRVTNPQVDLDPLPYGTHTFLIKSVDPTSAVSKDTLTLVAEVTVIPAVSISAQVIDNNVLLSWTPAVGQFTIARYELYRGTDLIGYSTGTFQAIFEAIGGTYTYKVIAVDVAGNRSLEATIETNVNQPPDYALQDTRTSGLNGTRVNIMREPTPALVGPIMQQSFQDHFVSRSWMTPANQVGAGFPIYIQPSEDLGTYTEIVDYGVVLSNVIVTVSFTTEIIADDVAVTVEMRGSLDGVNWSTPSAGSSQFFSQIRYLEFKIIIMATS